MSDRREYPEEEERGNNSAPREEEEAEYPVEEEHGNTAPQREEEEEEAEEESVCSSEARDRKDLEECPGEDLRAAPKEHSGNVVMLFYTVFAFLSFVLTLAASCPSPWLTDSPGRRWTVWKNWDGTAWKDYPCAHKRQMFQSMEAFAICSCIISLICFVTGLMQMFGRCHLGVTLLFAVIDVMVLLTDWALVVHQYHKYSCPGEEVYVAHINRLNAGFCLVFCSFGLMLFGLVALVYWMRESFSLSETHRDKYSSAALTSALVSGAVLTIATVGTAHTMWEQYYPDFTVKVTYWHIELYDRTSGLSEFWGLDSFHCNEFTSTMRAAAAFSIVSDAFLFLTLLFAVGAVYNRLCKWLAIAFGAASWVFLLVCWAISVATRYKTFCAGAAVYLPAGAPMDGAAQQVAFPGFVITEGLGMILSAWCVQTLNLVYLGMKA